MVLLLVDRASGGMLGVTLFDSEDAMRKGDEAMNDRPGNAGSRRAVGFYEVPLHTLWPVTAEGTIREGR